MKTYLKTLLRMFEKHLTRFLSIILIVLVSVGFISGIGTSTDKILYSMNDYYRDRNVSDLIVKNTKTEGFSSGFSDEQISAAKDFYGEDNVLTGAAIDVEINVNDETQLVRLYFIDDFEPENLKVNKPDIIKKESFTDEESKSLNIAYAEESDNIIKGLAMRTEIELNFEEILTRLAESNGVELDSMMKNFLKTLKPVNVTVGGTLRSPLTFARDGEPSWTNPEDTKIPDTINAVNDLITLDNILYMPSDFIPSVFGIRVMQTTDMFVSFKDKSKFKSFGINYENYLEEQKAVFTETTEAETEDLRFITLYDNYSFVSLNSYAEKVAGIGYVLMVAFLFVTGLVALSNMTRLLEEERAQVACLKTLGYSSAKIIFKYFLFAMIATGIGGVGSYFVGIGLAYLICYVFNYSFAMPPISSQIALVFYLIVFAVIVVTILGSTLIAGMKMTREAPANLLRPKPPKAGKKVIFERIPFIWNILSFKYKSTVRNVLRYKARFIMTVVSVAVSTALVTAGLALLDLCIFGGINSPSVMAIAAVVIVFAGLLTGVVIYTLTNINVSERNRELATLKVLGYHEREVSGYIYREVYIDTTVGIIFGYPLSALIILLVFGVMGMGTVGGVTWFWWLVSPFVVFLFTFIVTLMLTPKIKRIDMNESLKAIE